MARRYLVGGESNSSKSTFVLSLVECLKARGHAAEAVEFDVWSNSYPAFRGEIEFEKRPKRFDLQWNWRGKLNKRIRAFNDSKAEFVFGDMPGVLGAAVVHMCKSAKADGAIVICKSIESLKQWARLFKDDFDIPIVAIYLSMQKFVPTILPDMKRIIDPRAAAIRSFASAMVRCRKKCKRRRSRPRKAKTRVRPRRASAKKKGRK